MAKHVRTGALDLSEYVNDIVVPGLAVPAPDVSPSTPHAPKDLFGENKRAAWKTAADATEARCDFTPKLRITRRSDVIFVSLWKKSLYGRTLTDIKADDAMVIQFADAIAPLIADTLGSALVKGGWAIVTTPKRRHKQKNFATLISEKIAEHLGIPFYEDCAECSSKHRMGAVFTANNIPAETNIIVFDDFVTTGQTLCSMKNLLNPLGKNCVFFAGIDNKM